MLTNHCYFASLMTDATESVIVLWDCSQQETYNMESALFLPSWEFLRTLYVCCVKVSHPEFKDSDKMTVGNLYESFIAKVSAVEKAYYNN